MVMEITKTNGATMKGTFTPGEGKGNVIKQEVKEQLDKEVRNCLRENNIPELGWF